MTVGAETLPLAGKPEVNPQGQLATANGASKHLVEVAGIGPAPGGF